MAFGLWAGCAADQDGAIPSDPEPDGEPATTPSEASPPADDSAPPSTAVSEPDASPVTVAVAAGDEVYLDASSGQLIHRDGNGAYICVLRRSDDLADLRAGFNAASDTPAEAS